MKALRLLSLCAGIGGADVAAEWTGAIEVVGQVERDHFCVQVLEKHWPHVKRMGDIQEVHGDEWGIIDILVAGFPCQPHSLSGKRRASQDERDLWPEIARIIGTTRPRWFVGENVPGLLSSEHGRFFGRILSDMDTMGYRVGWCVYGASEIGAPHRRERVFLLAYASSDRQWDGPHQQECGQYESTSDTGIYGPSSSLAYSTGLGQRTRGAEQQGSSRTLSLDRSRASPLEVAYSHSERFQECNITAGGYPSRFSSRCIETTAHEWFARGHCIAGFQRTTQSGVGRDADGISRRVDAHRWPVGPGEAQAQWEPPRTITEKLHYRNQRLKALGNAIVPQQIFPLFEEIVRWEHARGTTVSIKTIQHNIVP